LFLLSHAAACLTSGKGAEPPPSAATNAPLKAVGPGLFEIGKVRLNKNEKSVSFPAVLNMSPGLVEYVLVTETGKIHESLLRTDAEPYQIHMAMLLLGAKGAGTNAFPQKPNDPLPGDKVVLDVAWKDARGAQQKRRAEELIYNEQTKSAMSRGPWVYNGSRLFEGTFIAQQDGSIVSLIEDPDALINNPRQGRENDEIWEVKTNGLPPVNAAVEVTIRLER
jgi:hypothetical protein